MSDPITIRTPDGQLDEIVATGCDFHLEQMDDGHWWLSVRKDGWEVHCNLMTKRRAKIGGTACVVDWPEGKE
jgi:hypothetical protein